MFPAMRAWKQGRALVLALAMADAAAIALAAAPAHAEARSGARACVDAYDAEQRYADAGDLLRAREQLYVCGVSSCPAVVIKQCVEALADVDARLPTIALAVQDAAGHDLTDVTVTLDGAPFRDRVDGREIPLNPGPHVLRISAAGAGASSIEVRLVAREREKGRLVRATLPASLSTESAARGEVTSPVASSSRVPALTFVFGAVGVVALGAFTYFGVTGLSARSDLDACSPFCADAQRDDARAKLRDAHLAGGVAVVSFGVAAAVYLLRPRAATSSLQGRTTLVSW
jgi:hypothetical protein